MIDHILRPVHEAARRYLDRVNLAGESLAERAATLMAALGGLLDSQARFALLVERARTRPLLSPEFRLDEFRVPGCQVRTWLVPTFRDGRCWFQLDSDAASLKAVGGLLCDFYNGQSPVDVQQESPHFLETLGLGGNLAENRRRTVWRIRELIRDFATAHLATAVAA